MLTPVPLLLASLLQSLPTTSAPPTVATAEEQEVVVTARRTGIPVWSVAGPGGTLVLVGAITPVAPATKWEPGNLTEAVKESDRVLFLNAVQGSVSPFQAIGWYLKFRNRKTLPRGQSLSQWLSPQELARLSSLEQRGALKRGWAQRNPLHLSIELRNWTQGKMKETSGVAGYVGAAARTYKRPTVPIRTIALAPIAKRFFALPPSAFLPCLRSAIVLAEAGPGVFKARSDAWAQRRVREVLALPGEGGDFVRCADPELVRAIQPDLRPTLRRLAAQPGTTLAVVDLRSLAESGGILDDLKAAGHDVRGPAWR